MCSFHCCFSWFTWCSVLYSYTFEDLSITHVKGFTVSDNHEFTSVFCSHCGYTIPVPVYCGNRFCPVCSNHRNRLIRHKLHTFVSRQHLAKYDSYKFLTLTVKDDPDLQRMTKELITAFRRLRQRSFWRKNVRGGASIIEVKPGRTGWHVHLHIVIESGYLPFKILLEEWKAVSTGQGVYIKVLHDSQVVSYLTKYLTKDQCTESEQKRITIVLKGVRLFQPFGSWHKPIAAIKRLTFECPECQNDCWGFGNRTTWFDKNAVDWMVDKRLKEGLPSMQRLQQEHLFAASDNFFMLEQ